MAVKVIGYKETLRLLKEGANLYYLGGPDPRAYMNLGNSNHITVRLDTLYKLYDNGLITHFGYPEMHSVVKLKECDG